MPLMLRYYALRDMSLTSCLIKMRYDAAPPSLLMSATAMIFFIAFHACNRYGFFDVVLRCR